MLLSAPGQAFNAKLLDRRRRPMRGKNKKLASKLIIHCQEVSDINEYLELNIQGVKLDKKDFLGSQIPIYLFTNYELIIPCNKFIPQKL